MSGPTSFRGVIEAAVEYTRATRQFHTLLIITDGHVNDSYDTGDGRRISPTAEAIVRAADFPLEILVVGVGDGPWDLMMEFDDNLPQRRFDNFQFVAFTKFMSGMNDPAVLNEFARLALMEVPQAFHWLQENGMFAPTAFRELPPLYAHETGGGPN